MALANAKMKKVSSHIPDDLEISILSKLPIKSLKRFGCARKSWSHFFENPNFLKSFISAHCLLSDDTCVLLSQIMPTPLHYGPHSLDLLYEYRILWNPATKECLHIFPPSPSQVLDLDVTKFNFHGFGYDHVRDDYKVIQCVRISRYTPNIIRYTPYNDPEVEAPLAYVPTGPGPLWEIYSIRSNCWRKLDVNVPWKLGCSEVYLNGMCHWLGGIHDEPLMVNCVVSFNFSSEVFITTPLLFDMHDDDGNLKLAKRRLAVLNGSIAMISKYSTTASFHISILGEPGIEGSWVKLFIVGPLPFIRHAIGAGNNGEVFFRTKDDDLVCFDLNTQMFEEVGPKGAADRWTTIYKMNLSPFIRV